MEYKHLLQWHSTCTHKAGIQNYGNQMESGGKQKKKVSFALLVIPIIWLYMV